MHDHSSRRNDLYPICKDKFAENYDNVCLRQNVANGINSWAEKKGKSLHVVFGTKVDENWWKNYNRLLSFGTPLNENKKRLPTRLSTAGFDARHNIDSRMIHQI